MIQHWQYLLCGALLLGIASQNQMSGQVNPLQPSASPAVQVYLTATGKDNVTAILTQSELSASINKQPAQITSLRSAKEDKLLFAMLIDISTSQSLHAESIKKAAMLLFQSLTTGGNQGHLVLFNEQPLRSQIPLPPPEARKAIDGLKFGGGTALYDAIWITCKKVLSRSGNPDFPRRVIILISDGGDNISHVYHVEAEEIAEKEGVAIFSLATSNDVRGGTHKLKEISNATGGRTILDKKLEEGVAPLLAAINGQWALNLVSQQAPDQKLHSLSVKTMQRDFSLTAPAKILLH
jgi:Mg-chelatase subunit ChlD